MSLQRIQSACNAYVSQSPRWGWRYAQDRARQVAEYATVREQLAQSRRNRKSR